MRTHHEFVIEFSTFVSHLIDLVDIFFMDILLQSQAKINLLSFIVFQSPKYAPPIEFVDQAALSPPEGYKDGGANLQQALGGALGGHIFGAQHIQQLQVIQRLQAQRAAMLAARATAHNHSQSQNNSHARGSSGKSNASTDAATDNANICTECSECSECAAKKEEEGT